MDKFNGFSAKETFTKIPDSFFRHLLYEITDEDELKVTLYALWRFEHMEGRVRFIRGDDFAGLVSNPVLTLEKAVQRTSLLKVEKKGNAFYFLNSPLGRTAAKAFEKGRQDVPKGAGASYPPPERLNIFKLYEENIGPLTPLLADALKDAEQTYPPDWVAEALDIAVKSNKRNWKYIEAILRRWKEEGHAKEQDGRDVKKLAGETSRAKSKTSSNDRTPPPTLGDPNCPYCHGLGYLRRDAEPGSPDFGKLDICVCRNAQVAQAVRERLFSLSHLDELQGLTFDSFKARGRKGVGSMQADSLEWAFNRARQYASSLTGWLVLQGGFGCGKTHLAAAIANFVVGMGVPTLFLTVPDLLDTLRFSFDSEDTTFEQRFDEIRNAPLLVLDDFGTQNATAWAQEKLFQIVNYRYINKLPLVVTTNLPLAEIEERIRSRLADPELVSTVYIKAPDYRRPTDDKGHPELSSLDLHARRTFASFDDRRDEGLGQDEVRSLEKAVKAATTFAAKPRGWLVITGPYGSGKTHLAAAIANSLSDKGTPPLFIMVPDLLDHLRATFSPSSNVSYDHRFDEIRSTPLLILDDLGAQSTSPWAKEKLHQLFNYRYNAELPTVLTVAVDMLESIDERLRVRLLDDRICTICAITAPAFHGGKPRKTRR